MVWEQFTPRRVASLPDDAAGARAAPFTGRSQPGQPGRPVQWVNLVIRDDLERIYRAEFPRVVGIARRVLGSGHEAEDVAQDGFIAFGRATIPAAQAPGWLAVAAAHTALNFLRSDARRTRRESMAAVPDHTPDIAEHVMVGDTRARVRKAIARLSRTQGQIVVLRHSGLSYQEIASALDLPVGNVGTTLRRAEAAVRKELDDDDSLI